MSLSDAALAEISVTSEQPHWFALYTCPRHEKATSRYLVTIGVEVYLPLLIQPRRWKNGCRVNVEEPLFPSYLFVRSNPLGLRRILQVPGAVRIVSDLGSPAILCDEQIDELRSGLSGRVFSKHPYLKTGQQVRVISGSLEGMTGILTRFKGKHRIVIEVHLVHQCIAIEVDADEIEAIAAFSRPHLH
jgi:transcription antitermination factor NusG